MKILFIWPRNSELIFNITDPITKYFRFLSKILFFRPPLTFSILAALTPKEYTIEIAGGTFRDIDFDKKYDLVGITTITPCASLAYDIADEFRRRGVTVVLGGYHATALPEEAKQHADAVVVGESEETWPELLKDFKNKKLKEYYLQNRPVNPKLIPHPRNIYPKGTGIGIQATRGCPFRCEFCSVCHRKFGNIYRMRPIESVVEEIRSHPNKLFTFSDNSLTINKRYTKQLFNEIKDMNKKFFAYGHIYALGKDEELLKLASEAGCIGWLIGFESVCQESIDSIGKSANRVSEYLTSVKKIHDYGMMIEASFVFGFDFDKSDIFMRTDEFVRKSEADIPFGLILTPYPGTSLFNRLDNENRILTRDWSKYNGQYAVFKPKYMTPEELLIGTEELNKKWHTFSRGIERIIRNLNFGFYPFTEALSIEIFWKLFKWSSPKSIRL
jgi:radical SAM superfamily enzyme YgiQ (UPF0313 family)